MTLSWPAKDPDEVLDYTINWSLGADGKPGRLPVADDQIATSTWIIPTGITKNSDTFSALTNIVTIWLSGGTIGQTYKLTNRITSIAGRTMDQTVKVPVKSK